MGENYYNRRHLYSDEQLVSCYLKYESQMKAADELGVSRETVARAVRRAGIPLTGRKNNVGGRRLGSKGNNGGGSPMKITDDQLCEAVKIMTRDEIAEAYGMNVTTVDRRMGRLGLHAKPAERDPNSGCARRIFGDTWHYVPSQREKFERLHPGFEYVESRSVGSIKRVRMKCRTCGAIVERAASTLRQKNIICDKCAEDEAKRKSHQTLINVFTAIVRAKTPRVCVACGKQFYSNYPSQKYCSETCKKRNRNRGYRSRCLHYGVFYDPKVTAKAVIERDGGICQICHQKCDENDRSWGSLGPKFPTVDHIIPLAKGGTHTWGNVQCACALCNSYKRDLTEAKGVS